MRPPRPALMILAAGFGTRMGALTASTPKPLIPIAGRPLIDHAMAVADDAGITRRVVNAHYLGDQIAAHLAGRDVAISNEAGQILETGGGLKKALPLLGTNPVLILNSDCIFTGPNPLTSLMEAWDGDSMDGLVLLLPGTEAHRTIPDDFILSADRRLRRANGGIGHVYIGAQILRTEDFAASSQSVFSINTVWDQMITRGRLFGVVHQGGWCDVGRPEGIAEAEALLAGTANV